MIALGPLAATVAPQEAADRRWDVVVIGAGPAGAMAAREMAQRGGSVLLVDRAMFPRWKVCGSCLGAAALSALDAVGLGDLVWDCGATPLERMILIDGRCRAALRLPRGAVLSRSAFDAALVREAIDAGAEFLPQTMAKGEAMPDSARSGTMMRLTRQANDEVPAPASFTVDSAAMLVATGLGPCQRLDATDAIVEPQSRIGAAAVLEHGAEQFDSGCVTMIRGDHGYVGVTRLEDGRLNLGAALEPALVREAGGLGRAAGQIIEQAALPTPPGALDAAWRGTPPLTQRRPPAGPRRFLIGDAAAYVDPFTGEGIGWALASGIAVAPLALAVARGQIEPDQAARLWTRQHRHLIARRQIGCRLLRHALSRPMIAGAALRVLHRAPRTGEGVARLLQRPLTVASAHHAGAAA